MPRTTTALASLRRRRGLSQQALAAASGVSVRAIRSIEGGGAGRPRRATVERLLLVLKPDLEERVAILGELGLNGEWPAAAPRDLFAAPEEHTELLRRLDAAVFRSATVYSRRAFVVRDRLVRRERIESVVVATEPRLASLPVVLGRPDVQVVAEAGCRVASPTHLTSGRLTLLEVHLPRALSTGEGHRWALDTVFGGAAGEVAADVGAFRGERVVVVQVQFDPQDPPRRCRQRFESRLGAGPIPGPAVPLDATGTAEIVVLDPTSGWHGVEWDW